MDSFLSVRDVLLPPPGPALSAVMLVLGIWRLGDLIFGRFFTQPRTGVEQAACFIGGSGVTGYLSYLMAATGFCSLALMRILGSGLLILALCQVRPAISHLRRAMGLGKEVFRGLTGIQRLVAATLLATLFFMGLASLAPPIGADVLNYHLGVPLAWLRHGGMQAFGDWMHPRFAAYGEAFNMLGLAMGTDVAGALLQFIGLLILSGAAITTATDRANAILGLLFVVGCPAMLILATTAKPMVFPVSATTTAMLLTLYPRRGYQTSSWMMAIVCLSVAVTSKHSFLLTAAVVGCLLFCQAWHQKQFVCVLKLAFVVGTIFVLPLYLQNLRLFGDPVSPFLERLKHSPQPEVTALAWHVRDFGEPRTMMGFLLFAWKAFSPVGLMMPLSLGTGILAVAFAGLSTRSDRTLLYLGMSALVMLSVFSQLSPRFFLEPYLWIGFSTIAGPAVDQGRRYDALTAASDNSADWCASRTFLASSMTIQLVGVALAAALTCITLFPGSLTPQLRDQVLLRRAFDYRLCCWIDENLPPDAVIAVDTHAHFYIPRRFVSAESSWFQQIAHVPPATIRQNLKVLFDNRGVTYIVVPGPLTESHFSVLQDDLDERPAVAFTLEKASRNPFSHTRKRIEVFHY